MIGSSGLGGRKIRLLFAQLAILVGGTGDIGCAGLGSNQIDSGIVQTNELGQLLVRVRLANTSFQETDEKQLDVYEDAIVCTENKWQDAGSFHAEIYFEPATAHVDALHGAPHACLHGLRSVREDDNGGENYDRFIDRRCQFDGELVSHAIVWENEVESEQDAYSLSRSRLEAAETVLGETTFPESMHEEAHGIERTAGMPLESSGGVLGVVVLPKGNEPPLRRRTVGDPISSNSLDRLLGLIREVGAGGGVLDPASIYIQVDESVVEQNPGLPAEVRTDFGATGAQDLVRWVRRKIESGCKRE